MAHSDEWALSSGKLGTTADCLDQSVFDLLHPDLTPNIIPFNATPRCLKTFTLSAFFEGNTDIFFLQGTFLLLIMVKTIKVD